MEKRWITGVSGRLWLDSSYSKNGNLVLHLAATETENSFSNTASAGGSITAVYRGNMVLCAGSKVHLTGKFSDSLFLCDSLEVTDKGPLEYIRSHLILLVTKRLSGFRLGSTLILGRLETDSPDQDLIELAKNCGCMHVLALSGMHLGIIGNSVYALVKKITKRKKAARFLSVIASSAFVFVAGPRPSLLRAWLYCLLFFTDYRERNACAYFIQLCLLPFSIFTQGAAYGYVSIAAITTLAPLVSARLKNIMPSFAATALGTSLSVIAFNAPLQILLNGKWYPGAIFAGPVASVLVAIQMTLSLVGLAFPHLAVFQKAATVTSSLLEKLLVRFSGLPASDLKGYLLLAVFVFSVIIKTYHTGGRYGKRIHG